MFKPCSQHNRDGVSSMQYIPNLYRCRVRKGKEGYVITG